MLYLDSVSTLASTLALLVARVGTADHEHDAATPHDLAVLADFLD